MMKEVDILTEALALPYLHLSISLIKRPENEILFQQQQQQKKKTCQHSVLIFLKD